jgi:hypothetical protein
VRGQTPVLFTYSKSQFDDRNVVTLSLHHPGHIVLLLAMLADGEIEGTLAAARTLAAA